MTTTTSGGWIETVAPGVNVELDPATMPHALVSEGGGVFAFKPLEWDERAVGDDKSTPLPSFVGRTLTDVFFARNRLGFLTGENVVLSRAGGQYYNFFREKASQVLDTDQIDMAATQKEITYLSYALPFNQDIVLFGGKNQFRLTSGQDLMTPKTVELRPLSEFARYDGVAPVSSGKAIYFAADTGSNSLIMEFTIDGEKADAADITEHVPRYLPPKLSKLTWCHAERTGIALSSISPNAVWVYNYFQRGADRLQAEWSIWRWEDGDKILDIGVYASDLVLLIQRDDGLHIEAVSLASGRNDTGADYTTHLDRRITEARCTMVFDAAAGVTVVKLPYANTAPGLQVWERKTWSDPGVPQLIHMVRRGIDEIVLTGDRRQSKFFVGVSAKSVYEFSEQFLRQDNNPRTDGRLQLRRFKANHGRSAAYLAEVVDETRAEVVDVQLDASAAAAYDLLKARDENPIATPGVSLTLTNPNGYGYIYDGPIGGVISGVFPDGRYIVELRVEGDTFSAPILPDGSFSFPASAVGIKTLSIVYLRTNTPIHRQVFGLAGPQGLFLITPGSTLLVEEGVSVAREVEVTEGNLVADDGKFYSKTQALSLIAATTMADVGQSKLWMRTLLQSQNADGSFPTRIDGSTGGAAAGDVPDLEDQFWIALALSRYFTVFPTASARGDAAAAAGKLFNYLNVQHLANEGVPNIGDLYATDGEAEATTNILGFFALREFGLTDDPLAPQAALRAEALGQTVQDRLWLKTEGRFAAGADEELGVFDREDIEPHPLGPAFLMAVGQPERAKHAYQWQTYFRSTAGTATGIARAVPGLSRQGDYTDAPPSVWAAGSYLAAMSMQALGDRQAARAAVASLTAIQPSAKANALAIIASNPRGLFGASGGPLWTEGSIRDDRTPVYTYRFLGTGVAEDGQFGWPVSANSRNATLRIKSLGALPFGIMSAEWEAFFTTRDEKA